MRLVVFLAVALLVTTAGCAGGTAGHSYLTVEKVDHLPAGQGAVAYQNLSPNQEDVFQEARRTGETVHIPKGTDRNEFEDPGYVRYDGDVYKTTVTSS